MIREGATTAEIITDLIAAVGGGIGLAVLVGVAVMFVGKRWRSIQTFFQRIENIIKGRL